eukprot:TRINITY_DN8558_c0_g1_i3.p1 TRINITY_DN8558_c0_g1~~TRINITY_DN8558_c0_g1_i3.p1  ORF type:complete len:359 (-),score=32.70 TRINITY_DN8558_c0_g1_i3:289-1365(-)
MISSRSSVYARRQTRLHLSLQQRDRKPLHRGYEAKRARIEKGHVAFLGASVELFPVLQEFRCEMCDVNLNSQVQYDQHTRSHRHLNRLRQHMQECGALVFGLPPGSKASDVDHLFPLYRPIDILLLPIQQDAPSALPESYFAHVTFASPEEAYRAVGACDAGQPTIGGVPVQVSLVSSITTGPNSTEQHPALDPIDSESQDHPAWTAATRRLRSGARTPEEAAQFCRQELASREIAQVSAIPVSVFERLCNVLTQTKGVLPGCVPPTLLYAQFHTHARGQAQTVPISVALDLLAPLQQQFSPLLPNAAEWLRGRFTKFCPEGTTQVDKSTFVALRNNIAWAYQATQYLEELLSPETMP